MTSTLSLVPRAPQGGLSLLMGAIAFICGVSVQAAAQQTESAQPTVHRLVVPKVLESDLSQIGRRSLAPSWSEGEAVRIIEDLKEEIGPTPPVEGPPVPRALQETVAAPVVGVTFDGIPATGSLPPDTIGDVGPKHYVQAVNTALAIYDKSGTLLAGPTPINALWAGFGGPCDTQNNGDPVVRYDHLADRWLVSQFALPGGAQGFHQCFAISRTPDPVSGGWFLYDFPTVDGATGQPVFPDYPKVGVWPDGYYMGTQRGFPNGGLDVWAFERDKMLVGAAAQAVQFSVPRPSLFLMPSDFDGTAPPPGTPNFFGRQVDGDRFGGRDRFEVFAFSVNWATPGASTFVQVADLATAPFDSVLCSASLLGACIPQPGVAQRLETLTVWPMWRLQYRNFGTHESMVTNHTVDANGNDLAGIRWYEMRRTPGGSWGIFQQGTHAPDATHRWMGSIAMDQAGNMALGYSASSDSVFPSIKRAGRLIGDPPGTLPQPETDIIVGNGAQTHSSSRWGNYSSMDVDPTDDCTFWYTTEYYDATSAAGWKTRVASFGDSSCGKRPPETKTGDFEYAAKLICGLQPDAKDMRIVRGFYATAINIHNPNDKPAEFKKKLALTYPPEEQKPGKIFPIARDKLGPDEALEVDCMDIQREVFPQGFPEKYIKGFVVVQSNMKLDVTAVYTAAGLDKEANIESVTSVDVEQILGRGKGKPDQCPDLTVSDIGAPSVSCPGGGGTCVTKVDITVANIGVGNAGAFDVRSVLDPAQSVIVDQSVAAGLAGGASLPMTVITPPGGNCFDPDCTITVTADSTSKVPECDEQNNTKSETSLGR